MFLRHDALFAPHSTKTCLELGVWSFAGAWSLELGAYSRLPFSLRRDGDERQVFFLARFGKREKHHHKGESAFGLQIAVVDPEPMIAVTNRHAGVRRLLL